MRIAGSNRAHLPTFAASSCASQSVSRSQHGDPRRQSPGRRNPAAILSQGRAWLRFELQNQCGAVDEAWDAGHDHTKKDVRGGRAPLPSCPLACVAPFLNVSSFFLTVLSNASHLHLQCPDPLCAPLVFVTSISCACLTQHDPVHDQLTQSVRLEQRSRANMYNIIASLSLTDCETDSRPNGSDSNKVHVCVERMQMMDFRMQRQRAVRGEAEGRSIVRQCWALKSSSRNRGTHP